MKQVNFFFIFSFLLVTLVYGAEKRKLKSKITILPIKTSGLNRNFKNEINKQVIRSIIVSRKYDLILNQSSIYKDNKQEFYQLKVRVLKNKKSFNIFIEKYNANDQLVQRLSTKYVLKQKLLYKIRKLLSDFIRNKGLIEKQENIILDRPNSPSSAKDGTENHISLKSNINIINDNKAIEDSSETQSKRILNKKKIENKKKSKKKKVKRSFKVNNYKSPNLDLNLKPKKIDETIVKNDIFKIKYNLELYFENSSAEIYSTVDLQSLFVRNNFFRIYPGFITQIKLRKDYDKKLVIKFALGVPIRNQENKVPTSKFLGLNYYDKIFNLPFLYRLGFDFDLDNFNSVGLRATNIQPWSLNILWFNIGLLWQFHLLGDGEIGPYVSTSFNGSSDYSNSSIILQASRIGIAFRNKIVQKYWFFIKSEKLKVNSTSLTDFKIDRIITKVGLEYYF